MKINQIALRLVLENFADYSIATWREHDDGATSQQDFCALQNRNLEDAVSAINALLPKESIT